MDPGSQSFESGHRLADSRRLAHPIDRKVKSISGQLGRTAEADAPTSSGNQRDRS
jgi:hypothetical protein